uniref:Uncharacterized protein n=1 Tax=Compsopogon caeruleus TaxID=31354 RepID=A0A7S1T5A2_9RHOD
MVLVRLLFTSLSSNAKLHHARVSRHCYTKSTYPLARLRRLDRSLMTRTGATSLICASEVLGRRWNYAPSLDCFSLPLEISIHGLGRFPKTLASPRPVGYERQSFPPS